MAKGARSKRMKMLRTQRRDKVAAWQEAAEQKRYASLAALAAAPRPLPPPGAMAVEAIAAVAADAVAADKQQQQRGRSSRRGDAMAVDLIPRAPGDAPAVAGGGVGKRSGGKAAGGGKAAAAKKQQQRRQKGKQHSILKEALGGWKQKKGFKAKRKGQQAPSTTHIAAAS
jgi:hypothetical protein